MNTNGRLISVLDAAAADASPGQPEVMLVDEQNNPAAYEAYVAKARAEADAQDKANRLRVAQEQLAEYAAQKEKDAADLLQQADAVQQIISSALQKGALSPDLLQSVEQLRVKVSEYAAEASAFAAQQKADVETLKRSSHQADLPAGNMDADMKRAREGAEAEGDDSAADDGQPTASTSMEDAPMANGAVVNFKERARYIPLRLTQDERRLLRLLEAALNVSEYTDKVDILSWRSKNQRVLAQIKDICAILSGLVVAQDYKRGQELIRDRDFKTNEDFFQDVFEAGRRYKIMNPEKMRSEYGKLMYMLMDSSDSTIQDLLEFNCVRPLKTVYAVLEAKGGIKMLDDPLMEAATAEIVAGDRPRYEVQRDIKVKEKARETLARRYKSSQLAEEDILQCLYAISDNNTFLFFNRDPIDRMIAYFTTYFKHDSHEPGYSLAIQGGREGARLTHNHERQYSYVLQSLTLWREISTDMFRLWYLAEQDMLRDSNGYRLVDTGQGLNRVQSAPSVSKAMHQILARCQARIGSWVGSSVVHLGDHNVPNALHFIDKYTQVPRILNPVVLVLDALPKICRDPNIAQYIDNTFGGLEQCRKTIMVDFCRHAFDGSGADNFFDAGSCIDGRLTSAWNWCSKIEKKAYYPVFKLAGFNGFDGDFK
eukprot:CAMPEP_0202908130 /NCGR_PEP_ID=MMETSP1392-20130828/44986_1 /ASSEMBLY_ACC=CAM_ASM_000868 /TAXON_ID=225041 /ORGANISM="Chlamydomonas chlamydogama, Strain SAG 11-48b" /LENGTH=653 /DNA_ID=CAMNT_0049597303 /DNA_START=132 /DNA_END=2093 /DNA_ORIENTATION=+